MPGFSSILVHCFCSLVNDKVEQVFTLYTSIWEGFSIVRLLIADTVCVELGEVRWEKRKDRRFALMDWDPKIAGWDLAELEPNDDPNLGKVAQQSDKSRTEADCMDGHVDLKLGGSSELGAPDQPLISMEISSSSPSKRARAPSSGGQNFLCLVDGCRADLTACREYHRRHKVCEIHSKTPVVMVGGVKQRFCQQCSRFHLLVEFDEVKRSCRKRLDGHNRRRRKPQPDSASSANLFSIQQGTRFPSYSLRSQNNLVERNWAGIIKAEEDTSYARGSPISSISNQHVPGSFSHSYEREEHIALLQDSKAVCRAAVEQSACLPPLKALSSVESSQSKIFSDGMNQVLDSDCALSLLSSPTQTSRINIGQMLPADRIPMGQPFVSSFQYSSLEQYPGSQASRNVLPTGFSSSRLQVEQVGDVLVCDTDAEAQCHGMFHVGGEGSSDGTSESLPFSWQ